MQTLLGINIKRCLKPGNVVGPPQLHAFSDGGNEAYGTGIFIRWPTSDGTEIVFVAAKAFVAPLKYKTTPRLEFMAAVAMVRLTKEVETALDYPFEFKNFWIGSRVVICWLLSLSSRYKPFVASRIQEFQDCSENYKEEIRCVPSDKNPADCLTKPISINNLASWHKGDYCEFLKLPEEFWPQYDVRELNTETEKSLLEEKPLTGSEVKISKKKKKCMGRNEVKSVMIVNKRDIESVASTFGSHLTENFSSWPFLVRSIALMKKVFKQRSFNGNIVHTPDDLNSAELTLFFVCQEIFRNNINHTKQLFIK